MGKASIIRIAADCVMYRQYKIVSWCSEWTIVLNICILHGLCIVCLVFCHIVASNGGGSVNLA